MIVITTTVNATKEKAWAYYTDPMHIVKWNFASPDWCCPSTTNDLTVGGAYKTRMEAKDGSFGFDFEAVYTAVATGESLNYTLGDGRKVGIQFKEALKGTLVVVSFDPENQNPLEMQKGGWQAILNNYKLYTENN